MERGEGHGDKYVEIASEAEHQCVPSSKRITKAQKKAEEDEGDNWKQENCLQNKKSRRNVQMS